MNKTVTINLGGQIFYVEESVFNTLQAYLDSLKAYFNNDPDGNEIISDIEYRLAELFLDGQDGGNNIVSDEQVHDAISTMGTVEDFQAASESEEHKSLVVSSQGSSSQNKSVSKILLRDPDDRVLSGVCSGLGHYINVNVLWIRLAFLVGFFFSGIGLIPYIILWIIMPKAVSNSDKLAMKGKPINVNTLRENVKSEEVVNTSSVENFITQLFQYAGSAIIALFKMLLIFLGFILFMAGLTMIVAIGALLITGGGSSVMPETFLGLTGFWRSLMILAGFLAVAIPVIFYTVLFLKLLLNRNLISNRRFLYALGLVWLVSVFGLIGSGVKIKSDFNYDGQVLESHEFYNLADTLTIKTLEDHRRNSAKRTHVNFSSEDFKIINDTLYSNEVELDIVPADIDAYRLDIIKTAKGNSVKTAENRASMTNFYWDHNESELVFDDLFSISEKAQWRKQSIKLVLNVPYGQIVNLDRNTRNIIYDIDNIQNIYDRDMAGKSWSSSKSGLSCLDCDKKDTRNSTSSESGIRAIDIEGALSIEIIQSDKSELVYSDALSDYYNFSYKGDKLLIRPIEEDIDGDSFANSSAKIYVTDLSDIYIKGLAEVDLKDLKGNHIDIRIEGAAQTDLELEYSSADIEIEGAANIDMSGSVGNLDLSAEGMMRIDADDLIVKTADIDMQGAMRADFHITENLDINLEGPSYVKYKGDPIITKSLSGPSRLVRM